jgi:hypothetical protein
MLNVKKLFTAFPSFLYINSITQQCNFSGLLLYTSVQLGLSHYRRNTDSRCLRKGAEEYTWSHKGEITGDSRALHNEELHSLCSSLNITQVTKSKMCRGKQTYMPSLG